MARGAHPPASVQVSELSLHVCTAELQKCGLDPFSGKGVQMWTVPDVALTWGRGMA
jgi:hypothetical protein